MKRPFATPVTLGIGLVVAVLFVNAGLTYRNTRRLNKDAGLFRPEVVLLDIGVPGMNGYDVARTMRQMSEIKDAVLVAQIGWGHEEDQRRSSETGFNAHLVKPVDPGAL
jgi:CheY-like chemotaxis protein